MEPHNVFFSYKLFLFEETCTEKYY